MSSKHQKEKNHRKCPASGILVVMLFVVFFSFHSLQLPGTFLDEGYASISPPQVSQTQPQQVPEKMAGYFREKIKEKEEENREEKSPSQSQNMASISGGFRGQQSILKSYLFFNPSFIFYHRVSLYLLFKNLRLDLD
ncbi:hypothetical protein [Cyclobacterium plantarum]|uniref:Conjugative transposon protein TraM n=1 Tax=Cyclobacterium plantarum TaxID=2716263 RepID=A0ABX0HCX5_9BACT|nr:hypothetical protein [Cyclobacterium plantarum]NHE58188.1 hypothetical protein [Cyclobacterium plantarum]